MSFYFRVPSVQWEAIPISPDGMAVVWCWFKPVDAQDSVVINVPPEFWHSPWAGALTARHLAQITGIEAMKGWSVSGQSYALTPQTLGLLDFPIPFPQAGAALQIVIWADIAQPPGGASPFVAQQPGFSAGPAPRAGGDPGISPTEQTVIFSKIESLWQATLHIETEVRRARMQIDSAISRLGTLNRDLNPDENTAATSGDKKEWLDARRWLREAASSLGKSMKEIDVGPLSAAGQRNEFADLYAQYVVPRIPFQGMQQAAIDFEMYHRTAQNVLQTAQQAANKGARDGERRATAVLQRIAQKVREGRNRNRNR